MSQTWGSDAHTNRFTLRIALGPHPSVPSDEVWELRIPPVDGRWDHQAALDEIQEEFLPAGHPHRMTESRSHTSWGADGWMAEAFIYFSSVGAEAVLATTIDKAISRLFKRLAKRGEAQHPLDREAAIAEGGWRIEAAFGLPPGTVRHLGESEEREGPTWELTYEDDEHEYTVILGVADGLPYSSKVSRKRRQN